jgi:hypothetical protein
MLTTLVVGGDYIDSHSPASLNLYLPPWAWPGTSRSFKPLTRNLSEAIWELARIFWLNFSHLRPILVIFFSFPLILMKKDSDYIDHGWRVRWKCHSVSPGCVAVTTQHHPGSVEAVAVPKFTYFLIIYRGHALPNRGGTPDRIWFLFRFRIVSV